MFVMNMAEKEPEEPEYVPPPENWDDWEE